MAFALHAVVKADQMVHFEAEYRALANGESIDPKSSIAPLYPFMDNGVIRVGGRSRVLNDWRSAVPFTGVTSEQTGHTCNQWCPQTNPAWWSHSNSGRDETSNLGHSGYEEGVSVHQEVCHVLPLQLRANTATHGWPAFQSHWGSRTCLLLCRPQLRRTTNIQKWNWVCQGLHSCIYMFCFKGSSLRSSIIIDVICDGGSSETLFCFL